MLLVRLWRLRGLWLQPLLFGAERLLPDPVLVPERLRAAAAAAASTDHHSAAAAGCRRPAVPSTAPWGIPVPAPPAAAALSPVPSPATVRPLRPSAPMRRG